MKKQKIIEGLFAALVLSAFFGLWIANLIGPMWLSLTIGALALIVWARLYLSRD